MTGPSLTDVDAHVGAEDAPLDVGAEPRAARRRPRRTTGSQTSPGAAALHVGRRPLRASPYSVNWLTTSTGAPDVGGRPLVAEQPEVPDLAGRPGDLVGAVVVGDARGRPAARARRARPTTCAVDRRPEPRGLAG